MSECQMMKVASGSFYVLPILKWNALMWCCENLKAQIFIWMSVEGNSPSSLWSSHLTQTSLSFTASQPHDLSSSRSVIWISSSENLFIPNQYSKLSSSSQPSVKPVILSAEHVSTLAGVHWVVRIIQWYSCYSLGFVIIPGISTFSQNKVIPFQIFD